MVDITPATAAALRTAMGLSQEQLGRMLHIDTTTIRRWESGRARPSRTSGAALVALAREHDDLAARMRAAGSVEINRDMDADASPPRGWWLAAAGRALMEDDEIDVDWR